MSNIFQKLTLNININVYNMFLYWKFNNAYLENNLFNTVIFIEQYELIQIYIYLYIFIRSVRE